MIKIIAATLLILLPDALAFAGAGQTFDWSNQSCQDARKERVFQLMKDHVMSYAVAQQRTEGAFKTCICSSGDEVKSIVDALVDSHEIELLLSDPVRTVTTNIEFGRDFGIMFNTANNRCYLYIDKTELCKNSGFINDAKSYFDVPLHYDESRGLCVVEQDHDVFKAND